MLLRSASWPGRVRPPSGRINRWERRVKRRFPCLRCPTLAFRLHGSYGVLGILGVDTGLGSPWMLLAMPIAVQEMVFAGWLLTRIHVS
jgi:hypothetical protein